MGNDEEYGSPSNKREMNPSSGLLYPYHRPPQLPQAPPQPNHRAAPPEEYFPEPRDQPLDFSRKRHDVRSVFSTTIPSPIPPEPTADQRYPVRHPSSPSDQSDASFENGGSEPEHSPTIDPGAPRLPLPPVPQLGVFAWPALYRDFRPNHHHPHHPDGVLDHTAGLLTTVQSLSADVSPTNQGPPRPSRKYARPFKAYPRDPLTAAVSMGLYSNFASPSTLPLSPETVATRDILSSVTDPAYLRFRQTMLDNKRIDAKRKQPKDDVTTGSQRVHSDGDSQEAQDAFATPRMLVHRAPDDVGHAGSDDGTRDAVGTSTGSPDPGTAAIRAIPRLPETPGGNRKRNRSLPEELKDEAYWERRRKNNEAAKRSRDARRAKEDEIAIRAAYLERENLKLRVELAALRNETNKLRSMVPVQVFGN